MVGKLNDKQCRSAKAETKAQKLADGGGMYLHVMPNGNKYWRLKYRFLGKEKLLALGVYPRVSLAEARDKRLAARKMLDQGQDPGEQKKLSKLEQHASYANNFANVAREWHKQKIHTWQPGHAKLIMKRLEDNIFPDIGRRPIDAIKPAELLEAIRKVEKRGAYDLAHRMLQTSGQIFRYAVATGRAERDITPDLQGALKPAKSKTLAHLSEQELPAFLKKLERYDSEYQGYTLTKLAFKLLILTFVRSGEIRGAKWDEISWEKAEWRIPAERMKMKEQHIVPLSKQSLSILKEIKAITSNSPAGYIFPSQQSPRKMMSENTFLRVIENLGYKKKTTGHGFRSTASTILNENGFRPDVIERQLAHGERDQIRAAYNHAEYLAERREMMQWWGDYLEGLYEKCSVA